ncbi:MAG: type I methionyl aminopeptidase [Deltaproteobacteria bacterium CG11_big_fil_rev_8_21_14_0_20_47_16]|nr:MAG: type I methionyl aminopeptidase [Deltaproteobacteria bacterium CG11_big_fil_rev_8_21_14_0_20_47_16]
MIILKSKAEIEKMRRANQVVVEVMKTLATQIVPGVTTQDLDRVAFEIIKERGGKPAFLGYRGFPATLCTSINEEVVHGIPNKRPLVEGDIVSVDCGVILDGFYGDHAMTFAIGQIPPRTERLLSITQEALAKGIALMVPGNRLGDVGAAIQQHVEAEGFGIVRDYVGHGIGRSLHEEPQVPNYGVAGSGLRLKAGMVLAVEPMVNEGTGAVKLLSDDWTVVTADAKPSAHFEHSVAVTENGPDILSLH